MAEVHGIKETKEAVIGALELTAVLVTAFRDGVQATDISQVFEALAKNEEVKAKLLDAYNGADQILAEVKDISLAEGIELAIAASPGVIKVAQAFSK